MSTHFRDTFAGVAVNQRLTFNTGMGELRRYVLEHRIDSTCQEETCEEGVQVVMRRLRENLVYGAEAERLDAEEPGGPSLAPSLMSAMMGQLDLQRAKEAPHPCFVISTAGAGAM